MFCFMHKHLIEMLCRLLINNFVIPVFTKHHSSQTNYMFVTANLVSSSSVLCVTDMGSIPFHIK